MAQARNPYSSRVALGPLVPSKWRECGKPQARWWLWIPGSLFARPGMTVSYSAAIWRATAGGGLARSFKSASRFARVFW